MHSNKLMQLSQVIANLERTIIILLISVCIPLESYFLMRAIWYDN